MGVDIISDTTGKAMVSEIAKQNQLLSLLTAGKEAEFIQDWDAVARAVSNGYGESLFSIGSTFTEPWTDTAASKEYDNPWRVNHFSDVELQDGSTVPGMWLQNVYTHPFGVQFSHNRAFYAAADGLAAGTYYFLYDGQDWGSNVKKGTYVSFTLTKDVPKGGRLAGCYGAPDQAMSNWRIYSYAADGIELLETVTPTFEQSGTSLGTMAYQTRTDNLNSMQETAYGWNRWQTSAIRQYLNSDKVKGSWWTAQDAWDIAPNELASKDGFLCGMDADMLANILPVKNVTYVNTAQDGTNDTYDVTYDKVSLISLEQMYITPQHTGEGEAHTYWKNVNGTSTKWGQGQTYPILKHFAVENQASAQHVRLRSALRGYALNTWFVNASGYVNGSNAAHSNRFAPLVVIGKSK